MEEKKIGWLGYNYENERFGILDKMDLWADSGLHCGECFEVFINGEWIPDRIEMKRDNVWYLVENKLEGSELEGLKVRR